LQGEVYDAYHKKRHLYNPITISAFDTPNVKQNKIVIEGMITKPQVDEWIKTFGIDDDFVRVFVFGEFPKQESNTLIPIDWLETAVLREPKSDNKRIIIGSDVAWKGKDKSTIVPMRGLKTLPIKVITKYDPTEVGNEIAMAYDDLNASAAFIDVIGIGAGALSELNRQNREYNKHRQVFGVNVSESVDGKNDLRDDKIRFFNLRSKIAWMLRESLDPRNPDAISIPNDPELIEELTAVRYKIQSEKVVRIEPKDETSARLKRSPDKMDGLGLANYGRLTLIEKGNSSILTCVSCSDDDSEA
jgi:hypothetical protein